MTKYVIFTNRGGNERFTIQPVDAQGKTLYCEEDMLDKGVAFQLEVYDPFDKRLNGEDVDKAFRQHLTYAKQVLDAYREQIAEYAKEREQDKSLSAMIEVRLGALEDMKIKEIDELCSYMRAWHKIKDLRIHYNPPGASV